jgi:siroheme synthase-like protein
MSGYPIVLTGLAGRCCVVVGGGAVAARKAQALVEAGARPVVIGPELGPEVEAMAVAGQVQIERRCYRPGDLAGAALAIAATGDRQVNAAVAEEARQRGVLVNVVDDPALCTFTLPAVVRRGDLLVAISTGGQSPAFARHLREMLEEIIDPAYGELLALVGSLRPRVLSRVLRERQLQVWKRLLDGELLAILRRDGRAAAEARAAEILDGFIEQETGGTGGTQELKG